ncbi:hypothetical protein PGB90_008401 [Kerria lacca]
MGTHNYHLLHLQPSSQFTHQVPLLGYVGSDITFGNHGVCCGQDLFSRSLWNQVDQTCASDQRFGPLCPPDLSHHQ